MGEGVKAGREQKIEVWERNGTGWRDEGKDGEGREEKGNKREKQEGWQRKGTKERERNEKAKEEEEIV